MLRQICINQSFRRNDIFCVNKKIPLGADIGRVSPLYNGVPSFGDPKQTSKHQHCVENSSEKSPGDVPAQKRKAEARNISCALRCASTARESLAMVPRSWRTVGAGAAWATVLEVIAFSCKVQLGEICRNCKES